MKASKFWGFGPRKSKSGFTLIELLIVMVIIAILAGVVVMAVGGVFGSAKSAAYKSVHDDIQNAVTAYATNNQGNFPTLATWVNVSGCVNGCHVLNMAALLTSQGGMLRKIPDGCYNLSTGTGDTTDNCGGNLSIGCSSSSHYVWVVDSVGTIFSSCQNTVSGTCPNTSLVDGYQGVWP